MQRGRLFLVIGVVLVIVGIVAFGLAQRPKVTDTPDTTEQPAGNQIAPGEPAPGKQKLIIGNPEAPITIVEYGDFQCPFCSQFFRQTEPQLIRDYIDTGKAKIEFRVETHIGEESVRAGEAAYCANDQQAFRAYHDELYKRQRGINSGTFSAANLKLIAKDLGLDPGAFASCLDNQVHRQAVEESHKEAVSRGVTTTPTFFIGERKIVGAQPYSIFRTVIDGSN